MVAWRMRSQEIEVWVLSLADRIRSRQPVEDFRVELKSNWPDDPYRAARRLAGHCNAARGESVLWVIGLDEKRGVCGASEKALPNWLASLRTHFDGVAPDCIRDLNVPVGDNTVVALLFATDRAPYVVKNPVFGQPNGGPMECEVPWRTGTGVHSARREDLLRLLLPLQRLPSIESVYVSLECWRKPDAVALPISGLRWELSVGFYIAPKTRERVVIPRHYCEVRLTVGSYISSDLMKITEFGPDRGGSIWPVHDSLLSRTIDGTPTELLIDGPGLAVLRAQTDTPHITTGLLQDAHYLISLRPVNLDRGLTLEDTLRPPASGFDAGGQVIEWWDSSDV